MGTMHFQLPAERSPDAPSELERAWIADRDQMPWPTRVEVDGDRLILHRRVEESGHLVAPWSIEGAGRLMGASAMLMERPLPYSFLLELARGKVSQLRSQAAEWQEHGLLLPGAVQAQIDNVSQTFCRAVAAASTAVADSVANRALTLAYHAAEQLVQASLEQLPPADHRPERRLETAWGCRVNAVLAPEAARALAATFGSISLAFPWSRIEPIEGQYDWSQPDALLEWAEQARLGVTGGPLVDFSSTQLPDWLWLWERDLTSLGKFLSTYVTAVLKRYGGRIRRWQLTSTSNSASVLSLSEHELVWLTFKAARVARQVDPGLELILGVAQPWCDYLAHENREQSPHVFAETLVRELKLAALDLEVIMGLTPRGSYCRDLLETSCLLDSYADLGVPLRVTLGYPSGSTVDPKGDPELCADAGYWHSGVHEAVQAEWATAFARLALAKPYVEAVQWVHLSDADLHQFPHCGLLNAAGKPKPSLDALQQFRQKHFG